MCRLSYSYNTYDISVNLNRKSNKLDCNTLVSHNGFKVFSSINIKKKIIFTNIINILK